MNSSPGTIISLDNVSIGYDKKALIPPLTISIKRGDFWGVAGPNGAGKSTLIKTILGIIPPVKEKVYFPSGKVRFGYVPQRQEVAKHYPLSAFDVALMGRFKDKKLYSRVGNQDIKRVMEEFMRLGISDVVKRQFSDLSGGQQQRVLIARALAADPDVLILDEPTTGMDLPSEADILTFLKKLHRENKMTIIMISHQLSHVMSATDHICLINKDRNIFAASKASDILDEKKFYS